MGFYLISQREHKFTKVFKTQKEQIRNKSNSESENFTTGNNEINSNNQWQYSRDK
jgi:hypothetical protein